MSQDDKPYIKNNLPDQFPYEKEKRDADGCLGILVAIVIGAIFWWAMT